MTKASTGGGSIRIRNPQRYRCFQAKPFKTPPHVLEAIAGHISGKTVTTTHYAQYNYADEKRAALVAWSEYVDRLDSEVLADVVAIR